MKKGCGGASITNTIIMVLQRNVVAVLFTLTSDSRGTPEVGLLPPYNPGRTGIALKHNSELRDCGQNSDLVRIRPRVSPDSVGLPHPSTPDGVGTPPSVNCHSDISGFWCNPGRAGSAQSTLLGAWGTPGLWVKFRLGRDSPIGKSRHWTVLGCPIQALPTASGPPECHPDTSGFRCSP